MRNPWSWLWTPSRFSLASLLIAGGVLGAITVGGFGAFVEYSNSMAFCTGCHEMDIVDREFQDSVHARNRSGVGAVCADCHVPKDWGAKLARKVTATKELYHSMIGTIDTPSKFEANRLQMARRVWASMEESDSLECRNCHGFDQMVLDAQSEKARRRHAQALRRGETCVDCHKGIAHHMPDIKPEIEAARALFAARVGRDLAAAETVYAAGTTPIHATADGTGKALGAVLAAARLVVLERADGRLRVRLDGWQEASNRRVIFAAREKRIFRAGLARHGAKALTVDSVHAAGGWTPVSLEGWVGADRVVADLDTLWTFAGTYYDLECGQCHMAYPADWYGIDEWADNIKAMKPYTRLDKEDNRLLQIYIQSHAPLEGRPPGGRATDAKLSSSRRGPLPRSAGRASPTESLSP